jgi:hypothetical protein
MNTRLTEPITIAEWWRDRGGRSVRVRLTSFEGHNLIDIRTWHTDDGRLVPGKGFACGIRHLPRLIDALTTALEKARELNLFRGERS